MSNKTVNYINHADLIILATDLGIEPIRQAGFTKLQGPAGRQVYVANTKKVGRIDISGFEVDFVEFGVVNLGDESFGAVKQQVDFTKPVEDILVNFIKILKHMQTLSPVVKEKKSKTKKSKDETNEVKESNEARLARLAVIREKALALKTPVVTEEVHVDSAE